jgi:Bacteriophage Lambda NinG protein
MSRCKHCRNKFEPIKFLQKYCLNDECVRVWVESEKAKQWKKTKQKAKLDLMTLSDYLKLAQQVFNKWINLRDKGKPCISCDKPITGRVNASHFWNANNHYNVRFNEDNVHSSCITCNQFLSGNLLEYRTRLISKIGEQRFNILEAESKQTRKFTIEELKEIIAIYKKKIKEYE